jgi:hypothetical protein
MNYHVPVHCSQCFHYLPNSPPSPELAIPNPLSPNTIPLRTLEPKPTITNAIYFRKTKTESQPRKRKKKKASTIKDS